MSVINVKEDYGARANNATATGRTGTRRFTVLTNSTEDGPAIARLATGVPRVGDGYPNDPFLIAADVRAKPVGVALTLFEVVVDYSTPSFNAQNGEENPLDAPMEIDWGSSINTEAVDFDVDGNPIVNKANEGFDPPVTDDFADPVLTLTRNQDSFTPTTKITYQDAVNTDNFYGALPGQAKMVDIRARKIIKGTFVYWQVSYVIQFREGVPISGDTGGPSKAWYKRILNAGYRDADGKEILDATGKNYSRPFPLAIDGSKLPEGDAVIWLEFKRKKTRAFAPLGLE